MDLAFHDHWIDHPAAVVHHDVALDFDLRRLRVYLDHHRMHAVRGATAVRSEVRRSLETGLAARPHGAAQRIRLERQRPERDAAARVAAQVYAPAVEHEIRRDRKSTRLNSSHGYISYAVFCLKKQKQSSSPDNAS